jgi:hypothetical protein
MPAMRRVTDFAARYLPAAKAMGASGLNIKAEPEHNLPDRAEGAMNPTDGGIGVRNDLSDAKMLETIIVELENMAQAKALADLQRNEITKMTRHEYIEAAEKTEFQSMQDGAKVWKAVAKSFGQDVSKMPSYGDPDKLLKMGFKEHLEKLDPKHKEFYGRQWDTANRRTR